jgi:Tfp pilus assembly protein PilO
MSQDRPMPPNALAPRRQISVRLDQIRRAPALKIIGLPELIGLCGAALLALLVIFAYFYFYLPAQSRLASTQSERALLQAQLKSFGAQAQTTQGVKESVDKINSSLTDFESRWLPVQDSGRMSLYAVVNDLIKSNGLRNTAGPAYSSLLPIGTKSQTQPTLSAEKQSTARWQTIYPGIAVSVTVEGPYQNVRHFVRDIEASRQFLIINAVELERVTLSGYSADQPVNEMPPQFPGQRLPSQPVAGTRGTLVSLRLDLATYFQRPEVSTSTP